MSTVADAITGRQSIRAFLDKPVPRQVIERILSTAGRAPSGTNCQPWKVWVVTGAARQRLVDDLTRRHAGGDLGEREYNYYAERWSEPFLTRRRRCGWGLYSLLGIRRGDTEAMAKQHRRNFAFFGAPVGLIFTMGRSLAQGAWLDAGMFIQSVMIAARGEGLETCPQAAFCQYHSQIRRHLYIPDSEIVLCGMALGHPDPSDTVNTFRTERMALHEFVVWRDA